MRDQTAAIHFGHCSPCVANPCNRELTRHRIALPLIQINSAAFGSREGVRVADLVDLEGVMTAPELAVLIGIIAAFTTFAAVLAWASWGDGKPV